MPEGMIIADIIGTASGGSNSMLYDLAWNWLPGQWQNAVVEITIGAVRYRREILDNGVNSLAFQPLPSGITVAEGNTYALSRPVTILKRILQEVLGTVTGSSDISRWGGTDLTGRDISADLANFDLPLTTILAGMRGLDDKDFSTLEADLENVLAQLDITLSALRDAICAPEPDARTLNDLYLALTDSSAGSYSGTTSDVYIDALDWGAAGLKNKTIIIANTGGANGLHYKVLTRATWDSQPYEHVTEMVLASGAIARHIINDAYGRITVQVKSAVLENHADYEVSCIGNLV